MTTTDWLASERGELAADRILDAAAEAFASNGVGATSMSDIAERAGCSRATLYRHYLTRHELRVRTLQEYHQGVSGDQLSLPL